MTTLDKIQIGQSARIKAVGGEGSRRQHFLDMGLIPDAAIKLVKFAPLGDPMEVMVHGYSLTLRIADARLIEVDPNDSSEEAEGIEHQDDELLYISALHDHNAHPGLGEEGIYHDKTHEQALPKGTLLTFDIDDVDGTPYTYNEKSKQISFEKSLSLSAGLLPLKIMTLKGIFDVSKLTDSQLIIQQTKAALNNTNQITVYTFHRLVETSQ